MTLDQSVGSISALRNLSDSIPATDDKIRPTNCSLDISREKKATVLLIPIATF